MVSGLLILVPQYLSQQARLAALRANAAHVALMAASVLNGDLHRRLIDSANYNPSLYAKALEPLVNYIPPTLISFTPTQ